MSENQCNFCKRGVMLKADSGEKGYAWVVSWRNRLDVQIEDNLYDSYECSFTINYCPMCGRKLEG